MNASDVSRKITVLQSLNDIFVKIIDLAKIPLRTNSGRIGFAILIM